jgi:hypothetical protein
MGMEMLFVELIPPTSKPTSRSPVRLVRRARVHERDAMSLVNKAENKAKRGGSLEGVLGKPHTTRPPSQE